MTEFEARLKDLASQIGVELTEPKLSQFSAMPRS